MSETRAGVDERMFPIMDGPDVGWSILKEHEKQAVQNHSQSLERLAERGGLSSAEAWLIVNDLGLREMHGFTQDYWRERWKEFVERCKAKS